MSNRQDAQLRCPVCHQFEFPSKVRRHIREAEERNAAAALKTIRARRAKNKNYNPVIVVLEVA